MSIKKKNMLFPEYVSSLIIRKLYIFFSIGDEDTRKARTNWRSNTDNA